MDFIDRLLWPAPAHAPARGAGGERRVHVPARLAGLAQGDRSGPTGTPRRAPHVYGPFVYFMAVMIAFAVSSTLQGGRASMIEGLIASP